MNRSVLTGVVAACMVPAFACAADHTTDGLDTVKKNVADDARHFALSDLKAGVPADTLKKVVPAGSVMYLHCASGRRCLAEADLLKKQGYDVRPLKDGFDNLVKEGFEKAK